LKLQKNYIEFYKSKKINLEKIMELEDIKLIKLLTPSLEIIIKDGKAVEGLGIYDCNGSDEYIAGWDENNNLFANEVDEDNYVLDLDGNRTQYQLKVIVRKKKKLPRYLESCFSFTDGFKIYFAEIPSSDQTKSSSGTVYMREYTLTKDDQPIISSHTNMSANKSNALLIIREYLK